MWGKVVVEEAMCLHGLAVGLKGVLSISCWHSPSWPWTNLSCGQQATRGSSRAVSSRHTRQGYPPRSMCRGLGMRCCVEWKGHDKVCLPEPLNLGDGGISLTCQWCTGTRSPPYTTCRERLVSRRTRSEGGKSRTLKWKVLCSNPTCTTDASPLSTPQFSRS